jgi:hypothetical protein
MRNLLSSEGIFYCLRQTGLLADPSSVNLPIPIVLSVIARSPDGKLGDEAISDVSCPAMAVKIVQNSGFIDLGASGITVAATAADLPRW